jgi:hypothetical protein
MTIHDEIQKNPYALLQRKNRPVFIPPKSDSFHGELTEEPNK